MATQSSSKIEVDRFRVCLDYVMRILDRFEGGLATNWSEASSLK